MQMSGVKLLWSVLSVLCASLGSAWAEGGEASERPALLEVVADFDQDGTPETHRFTQGALAALGEESFTTSTIWTEGPQQFTGLRLHRLLQRLGAQAGSQITLVAANDYQITMPAAAVTPDGALLAYLRNGAPMSLREKGPVWLVYPYDSSDEFRSEVIYSRSVWQLAQIIVTP
jgi:hypothetical protein